MIEQTFNEQVEALIKPASEIINETTPLKAHLSHMVFGVTGEVGELVDALKKHCIYNKEIDMENVVEELGDIEFFLEGIRRALKITRDETLKSNITKLSKRYSAGKYTNEQAHERADKVVIPEGATHRRRIMFTKDKYHYFKAFFDKDCENYKNYQWVNGEWRSLNFGFSLADCERV